MRLLTFDVPFISGCSILLLQNLVEEAMRNSLIVQIKRYCFLESSEMIVVMIYFLIVKSGFTHNDTRLDPNFYKKGPLEVQSVSQKCHSCVFLSEVRLVEK